MQGAIETMQQQAGKGWATSPKPIGPAVSAYAYTLLIKHLLHVLLRHVPDREIVYRNVLRYDYRTLAQRIGMGGNGILLDHNVGRFVADAEAIYSYEGTREINALVVGRAITGLSAFI